MLSARGEHAVSDLTKKNRRRMMKLIDILICNLIALLLKMAALVLPIFILQKFQLYS